MLSMVVSKFEDGCFFTISRLVNTTKNLFFQAPGGTGKRIGVIPGVDFMKERMCSFLHTERIAKIF